MHQQMQVRLADEIDVVVLTLHRKVAQFDHGRPTREMIDQLGNEEMLGLPWPGVVERPGHHHRQTVGKRLRHVFHGQLAGSVVIHGCG